MADGEQYIHMSRRQLLVISRQLLRETKKDFFFIKICIRVVPSIELFWNTILGTKDEWTETKIHTKKVLKNICLPLDLYLSINPEIDIRVEM